MSLLTTHHELDELGGGRFRSTLHMKRIAHRHNGSLRRNVDNWGAGDATFRHVIETSSMWAYWADGAVRLCPTRDSEVYVEFGRPLVKPVASWQNLALAMPTRSGNSVVSVNGSYDVSCVMGGFKADCWDIEFKGGWQPPNSQIAFRVGLNGMTRQGRSLLVDGVPQMRLREPYIYDAHDPVRESLPVATDFIQVGGEWYLLMTLPDLSGLTRPCLDPTLELQPDASDGKDTFLDYTYDYYNYGVAPQLHLGATATDAARVCIAFDLSTLPANATLSSAVLSLYAEDDAASSASTVAVYRLKVSWLEGTRNGVLDSPATGASWNLRNLSDWWTISGGWNVDDCEQDDIGYIELSNAETLNAFKNISLTPTTKDALDLGYGWLLKATQEGFVNQYHYASSDSATAANRPKFTAEYTLPPPGTRTDQQQLWETLVGGALPDSRDQHSLLNAVVAKAGGTPSIAEDQHQRWQRLLAAKGGAPANKDIYQMQKELYELVVGEGASGLDQDQILRGLAAHGL